MDHYNTLNEYIVNSIRNNWDLLALTDFRGTSYQFRDVARKSANFTYFLKNVV